MPVHLTRNRQTGAIKWHHTCEVCGKEAMLATGCFPGEGMALLMQGKREAGYAKLGTWYCAEHYPKRRAAA